MRRTGAGVLVLSAVLGAAAGFLLDNVLTAGGRATFTPALTLPALLVVLGVADLAFAIPVSRAVRGRPGARVDPFQAVRVAMLAKASSVAGAVIGGFGAGLLVFVLTRPVTPSLGSMATTLATVVAAALLVAAGLVAEHLCTIRKDDDDEQPGGPDPGLGSRTH